MALDVKSPRIGKKIKQIPKTTKKRGIRLFMGVRLFMAAGVVFTSLLFSTAYADELYSGKTFEEKVKLFCEQAKVLNPDFFISMQLNLFLRYKNILILEGNTQKERRYLLASRTINLDIQQKEGPKLWQGIEKQEKKNMRLFTDEEVKVITQTYLAKTCYVGIRGFKRRGFDLFRDDGIH